MFGHAKEETEHILGLMSQLNRSKVRQAQQRGGRIAWDSLPTKPCETTGKKIQRAEVRFDQISGLSRTPVGGSSRNHDHCGGTKIRMRLLSPREAARADGCAGGLSIADELQRGLPPNWRWPGSSRRQLAPLSSFDTPAKRAYLAVA